MAAIYEPLFTKLKPTANPCLTFEPVAQPKLRLGPLGKYIKSEPMGSIKMFQKFETEVLTLSLRPGAGFTKGLKS